MLFMGVAGCDDSGTGPACGSCAARRDKCRLLLRQRASTIAAQKSCQPRGRAIMRLACGTPLPGGQANACPASALARYNDASSVIDCRLSSASGAAKQAAAFRQAANFTCLTASTL